MTEEQIQRELKSHADKLAKATREKWAMLPITMEEKEWQLRWDAHLKLIEQSNERIRDHERQRKGARHAKAS